MPSRSVPMVSNGSLFSFSRWELWQKVGKDDHFTQSCSAALCCDEPSKDLIVIVTLIPGSQFPPCKERRGSFSSAVVDNLNPPYAVCSSLSFLSLLFFLISHTQAQPWFSSRLLAARCNVSASNVSSFNSQQIHLMSSIPREEVLVDELAEGD